METIWRGVRAVLVSALGLGGEEPGKVPNEPGVVTVARYRKALPPGEWKHICGYVSHFATGFIAAAGMIIAPAWEGEAVLVVPFGLLTAAVLTRQTVEFMRRGDTPGRDLHHHIMGFVAGLGTGLAALAWWL